MNLGMFLAKLQELIKENPKLKNYAIRFREERGGQEAITHFHIEGRTIIFSNIWALDALTPDSPDHKKMKAKLKELNPENQIEEQVNISIQPPIGYKIVTFGKTKPGDITWHKTDGWVTIPSNQIGLDVTTAFGSSLVAREA